MRDDFSLTNKGGAWAFAWLLSAFFLIAAVPFLSILRVGPLSSFYLESGSLVFALLLVLLTFATGRLNVLPPRGTVYFLLLAAFWHVQARVMGLDYLGMSDMAAWAFVVLSLAAWACRGWVASLGQERVTAALAWVLLIGGCLQAAVAVMQYAGWTSHFTGYLALGAKNNIIGQLGQRNHLGHYLMWGLLSAAWLWSQRRLHALLGASAVLFLSGTMGLVNSRTILLYVAAVGLLALFWRWRQGRGGNRLLLITLFALSMVVAVQFSLNAVLGWLGISQVETALQRMEGSSFAMSARDLEWRNAWRVFQDAPLWGHGWDSYPLQGFLAGSFPNGFSPNGISVLFTHSHNIVLQLLAEMGLVGTLLVFGGALWVIWPYFRRPASAESMLPLALMTVSLCHSMLEYPLWYIYFLTAFAVMMSITPSETRIRTGHGIKAMLPAASAFLIICGIVKLGFVYNDLVKFDRHVKTDTAEEVVRKVAGLERIARTEPLLAYYADLSLTRRGTPFDPEIRPWAAEASKRALRHRPYATAYQYALYEYREGNTEKAAEWLEKLYRYYPSSLNYYAKQIHASPYFKNLYPDLYRACEAYQKLKPRTESCPRPEAQ